MNQMRNVALGIALVCTLLSVGCANESNREISATQKLGEGFTAEMTMTMDDFTAVGTIMRLGEESWNVYFEEPSSLAGVTLDFSGDEVSASYQGLAFSVPQTAMPAKSVLCQLILVVDGLAEQEEIVGKSEGDSIVISDTLDGMGYTLTLTKDGALSAFSIDSMDAVLEFTQFQSGVTATPITTIATAT